MAAASRLFAVALALPRGAWGVWPVAAAATRLASSSASSSTSTAAKGASATAAPVHRRKAKRREPAAQPQSDPWGFSNGGVTSLMDDPYNWDMINRVPREAPMWMVYDAERDDAVLPKAPPERRKKLHGDFEVLRPPMRDAKGRASAVGRRKNAIAQGSGVVTINGRSLADYFPRFIDRHHALEPFLVSQAAGAFDVLAKVHGGGISGQSGALRHGLARALVRFDPLLRPPLAKGGFLERDPRMVERKKPGQLKARRKFQWVRR